LRYIVLGVGGLVTVLLITLLPGAVRESTMPPSDARKLVPPGHVGMWIDKAELQSIPMRGSGWQQLKSEADDDWGPARVADNDSDHDVSALAGALVFARLHPADLAEPYRDKVADALMAAIGTERGSADTSLGRNLSSYVIAADLINFPTYDPEREARWREWLVSLLDMKVGDMTLAERHETTLNNHGTMSGGSRIAAAIYLGDVAELERAATVFRGWLGDLSAYDGFSYQGELDWFCDPDRLIGINERGCTKTIDGAERNIDGVLPAEQFRAGPVTWPPGKTNYVWGGLQGATMQAELLRRQGFDVLTWADSALLRTFDRLWNWEQNFGGWWGDGGSDDSSHVPALATFWFGDQRDWPQFEDAGKGKNYGWTEWTHGTRTSSN
jgi:Alginate lyase